MGTKELVPTGRTGAKAAAVEAPNTNVTGITFMMVCCLILLKLFDYCETLFKRLNCQSVFSQNCEEKRHLANFQSRIVRFDTTII